MTLFVTLTQVLCSKGSDEEVAYPAEGGGALAARRSGAAWVQGSHEGSPFTLLQELRVTLHSTTATFRVALYSTTDIARSAITRACHRRSTAPVWRSRVHGFKCRRQNLTIQDSGFHIQMSETFENSACAPQRVMSPSGFKLTPRRPPLTQIECVLLLFCTTKSIFVRNPNKNTFSSAE